MSQVSPEPHPDFSPDLAAAIELLAANAFFEAARDGEAGPDLAGFGAELRALTHSPGAGSEGAPTVRARSRTRLAGIGQRIGRIRQKQCQISGLADKITATARRVTHAFHRQAALPRVVVYSGNRARRLCLLVAGIEAQQVRLSAALDVDRERADAVARALAAARAEDGTIAEAGAAGPAA